LPQYPSLDAAHRMLDACTNERDRMLIALLLHTGGRVSEVLDIRVGDITKRGVRMVNLKQGQYQAIETTGENGERIHRRVHVPVREEKHVFLNPAFLAELRTYAAHLPPGAPLVGRLRDGRPMGRKNAWKRIKAIGARAGVTIRRFSTGEETTPWCHSFRHLSAVTQLEQGVSLNAVQQQLGHKSLASTAIYLRLADPDREKQVRRVRF